MVSAAIILLGVLPTEESIDKILSSSQDDRVQWKYRPFNQWVSSISGLSTYDGIDEKLGNSTADDLNKQLICVR